MTGSKACSPATTACADTPADIAAAAAASEFLTLCRPAMASRYCKSCPMARACTCQAPSTQCAWTQSSTPSPPAPSRAKVVVRRLPDKVFQIGVNSSSLGNTTAPCALTAAMTEPFSSATARTVCMNSICSRWALLTTATVGCTIAAKVAISPGWFMPSSSTAIWCCWRRRNKVSGTPMSLLRFPRVASEPPSGQKAARMDANICVTVVLPLLPVTAITGMWNCTRQVLASAPSANRVSATVMQAMPPTPLRSASAWQIAATAPRCAASARKALAS